MPARPVPSINATAPVIGVFDSGVGGLSVMKALRGRRPGATLHYLADSGYAPYGDREPAHVVERSLKVAEHLVQRDAGMIVVACNTATAWAIEALRERYPLLDIVGVEPGIKPAAALSRNGRIGVLATPATLASPRFAALRERHAAGCEVVEVPCPGLAAAIEQGLAGHAEVERLLDRYCEPLLKAGADTVVLGCTHYPFVADQIARRLGKQVQLLDTSDAVARHALSQWLHGQDETLPGLIRLQTTGSAEVLARLAQAGLGLDQAVEQVAL